MKDRAQKSNTERTGNAQTKAHGTTKNWQTQRGTEGLNMNKEVRVNKRQVGQRWVNKVKLLKTRRDQGLSK